MLRQHIYRHNSASPQHQPGEVVNAFVHGYRHEARGHGPKLRPVILIRCGDCEHLFAGLTTKPQCTKTGYCRPPLPATACLGLPRQSFLWTTPDDYVSRLDVRQHLGWITHEVVTILAENLRLDAHTHAVLWRAATIRGPNRPRHPR